MNWSIEDERVVPREELFMPKLKKLLQQPLNWSKVDKENFNCKNPEYWLVLTQKRCCKLSKLYKAGHKNQWLGAGRSRSEPEPHGASFGGSSRSFGVCSGFYFVT